jgi:hypothetical protein
VLRYNVINMTSTTQRLSGKECGDARLKACLLLLLVTALPETAMSYSVNNRPVIGNVQIA